MTSIASMWSLNRRAEGAGEARLRGLGPEGPCPLCLLARQGGTEEKQRVGHTLGFRLSLGGWELRVLLRLGAFPGTQGLGRRAHHAPAPSAPGPPHCSHTNAT